MGSRATVCLKSHSRKLDNSVRLQIGRPIKLVPLLTLNLHSPQLAKGIHEECERRQAKRTLQQLTCSVPKLIFGLFTIGANLVAFESWWRRRGMGRCRRARRRGVRRGWRPSPTSPSCSSWNSTGSCGRPTPPPPRLGMDLKRERIEVELSESVLKEECAMLQAMGVLCLDPLAMQWNVNRWVKPTVKNNNKLKWK